MNYNSFGSGCENISFNALGGRGNTFGDECKNLSFTDPSPSASSENRLIGCDFCRGIQNKTFQAVMHGCSFIVPNQETATITVNDFKSQVLHIDNSSGSGLSKSYTESDVESNGYNFPNSTLVAYIDSDIPYLSGTTNNDGDPIEDSVVRISGKAYIWTYNGLPLNSTLSIRTAPENDPTASLNG